MSLPPILTTTEEIAQLAARLSQHAAIAVDLEADSMHNYLEKVCLLQFSTPDETVLVDPLADVELAPLKPVLADPAIRKIFHAADYDIRCLARDFDIEINGLFDTMISSQFLGEERFGLADVLKKYFGVGLDKKYQRADWSRRPLSDEMIRYAAGDTFYLHRLVEILEEKLIEKGRLEWVQEEFQLLEKVRFTVHEGPEFLRFKGAGTLNPRQLAVLESLLQWRDSEAQRRDCPLYKVLGNKQVLELARAMPQGRKEMAVVPELAPRLVERYAGKLLFAVTQGLEVPDNELPHYPRMQRREKDLQAEQRFNRLKDWRKGKAESLELDPGVLINNAILEELAKRWPKQIAELADIPLLKRWQVRELGADILKVLRK
ncbi:ribonuclease D [Pelobacter seleniigenes]|uniref:ribonuclease D n=1 Tax=Pelobacter seleniigenes TaxID=407188 RepID=UPI0004A6B301|nr:ribonuclease D [Pelobacter seleniigenes]